MNLYAQPQERYYFMYSELLFVDMFLAVQLDVSKVGSVTNRLVSHRVSISGSPSDFTDRIKIFIPIAVLFEV